MIRMAAGICAAASLLSCVKDGGRNGCEECLNDTIEFKVSSPLTSKSSFFCSEDLITSFNLLIYSGDYLVSYASTDKDPRDNIFVFRLPEGQYDCYAVANVNGFDPEDYTLKDSILDFYIDTDGYDFDRYGFPMTWTLDRYIDIPRDRTITIDLERIVSRWEFSVDLSELPELVINSVQMSNVAAYVKAFGKENHVASSDGDFATYTDVKNLNDGGSMVFYVPENLQGDLLAGNTDPYEKNYETLCDAVGSKWADRCTYLELTADFDPEANDGSPTYTGSITYRFYLGDNDTSNFDILRNTTNEITLTPTLSSPEATRPDGGPIIWKAEPDVVKYRYEYTLELSKEILTSDNETFSASVWRQVFKDGVESGDPVDVTDSFTFGSNDIHIVMDGNEGRLEAGAEDHGTATVLAEDSRGNQCSAEISWELAREPVITVEKRFYVQLDPEYMGAGRGSFKARIIAETSTYVNGVLENTSTMDITEAVGYREFTTDNPDVDIDNRGNGYIDITVEHGGSAMIYATGTAPESTDPIEIEPAELIWDDAVVTFEYTYKLVVNEVTYNEAGSATMTKRGTINGYIMQEARKYINGTLVAGPYESNITQHLTDIELNCLDPEVTIDFEYINPARFRIGRLETSHVQGQASIYATAKKDGEDIPIIPGILIWDFSRTDR